MDELHNPLNVFSFCPRCGSDHLKPTSDRSFRCLSCDFVYYFNMAAAVAALIFDEEGKLLMTRRAIEPGKGKLDLPGGFVDMGEDAEAALRREIQEELGITVQVSDFMGSYPNRYLFGGLLYQTLDLIFRCKSDDLSTMQAGDDIISFEFIRPELIDVEEIGLPSVVRIIRELVIHPDTTDQKLGLRNS